MKNIFTTGRTRRGVLIASLGKFTEEDLSAGWDELEALLDGRKPTAKHRRLGEEPEGGESLGWELADLSKLRVERAREFGSVFLALPRGAGWDCTS